MKTRFHFVHIKALDKQVIAWVFFGNHLMKKAPYVKKFTGGVEKMADINWTLIAPIIVLQVILQVAALVSCFKSEELNGPKWMWVALILVAGIIGPVVYFTVGRKTV